MDKNVIDHVFLGKGRMNRRQYLNIAILLGIFNIILMVLSGILFGFSSLAFFWTGPILITCYTPFLTSIMIRRSHDISAPTVLGFLAGISYWMSNVIPTILATLSIESLPLGVNGILSIVYVIFGIYSVALVFFPGTKNINKYGEQPKNIKIVSEIIRFWWTGKS